MIFPGSLERVIAQVDMEEIGGVRQEHSRMRGGIGSGGGGDSGGDGESGGGGGWTDMFQGITLEVGAKKNHSLLNVDQGFPLALSRSCTGLRGGAGVRVRARSAKGR